MTFTSQFSALGSDSKALEALLWTVFALGVLKATTFVLSFSSLVLDLFVLPGVNFRKYGAKKGQYCVITGASDGIGKEYASQLAKRGFNLILISRTQSKLVTLKSEFESKYDVKVRILAIDIAEDVSENYIKIQEACSGLPITILINNVGQSHSIPVPFLETEEHELRNIITINTTATLKITQLVAPLIVKSAKEARCKGLILTMGSFGGLLPTPYLATYSGSKAFLQSWSAALAGEMKSQNVDVEIVLSYLVTSAMSKIRRTSMMIPNPTQFVAATLKTVGRRSGAQERYATMTPYWSHALYHFVIENTIGVYSKLANSINYTMHKSIRSRALRKAARQAKQQ
ncbi:LANO_0E09538g1_1 [Lachancea nothofagi CBS 11611]|uniref:Very-long-chain 3-oxoacyl-CoA reductase n=1 Tax=Lachancea nothofagi CBS 11611 TaxID=1266666 RepID=A0A1G4JVX2_9SACH|nr:LANO_0E09538g1_1 [Lachancea nothofagi CBS 11611]